MKKLMPFALGLAIPELIQMTMIHSRPDAQYTEERKCRLEIYSHSDIQESSDRRDRQYFDGQ
jgi:hypothetical protein